MSTDFTIVLVLSATVALVAVLRGGKPERYCAAIIAMGIIIDRSWPLLFGERSFDELSISRLLLDLLQLAAFLFIALHANRTWPLWLAAAQIVCITGSIAVLVDNHGARQAYWALTQLPIFVQLAALGLGTLAHEYRVRRVGAYNSWSPNSALQGLRE